ncbi:MAG: outer membrane beta-barrel protein [Bacteroidaceae bacterium]|nr:outer membrane beta-barrel protein [Bacteroidaceae bacterium]
MKKVFLFVVIMTLLPIMLVNAQSLRWGVKGGTSFTEIDEIYTQGTGWFVGPMLDVTLPFDGISADASLLFHQIKYNKYKRDRRDNYIELPLNIKWEFLNGKLLGLYLGAGPQLIYVMDSDNYYNRWAASFNIGGGLTLLKHLQLGVNYNLPLGRTVERLGYGGPARPVKRKGVWVSLAYLF